MCGGMCVRACVCVCVCVCVCFTHRGGSYVHKRGERFDVALGLRVINYVWRHRDLERACVRGIHVYVGCVCVCARA